MGEDVEERTSGQGFLPKKAGPTKAKQSLGQTPKDESTNEGPSKKTKPPRSAKRNVRQTPPIQLTVPGPSISINNNDSGTMYFNKDFGNIYDSTISNVGTTPLHLETPKMLSHT